MALLFKSTALLPLLLVILLPNGGDSSIFDFAFGSSRRSPSPPLVDDNEFSRISVPGSSGIVRDNQFTTVDVANAKLDVQDNQFCRLAFEGGRLKLYDCQHCVVSGNDNDFGVRDCQHCTISGQNNKGTFRDNQHLTVAGQGNDFDVVGCQHATVKASSNKMTIFARNSQHVSIQDSSNSQVKMTRVEMVQVSGKDVTLEGTDIKHHTFLGKSCSGNKIIHKLTFIPSEECGFFSKLRSKFFNSKSVRITMKNGVTTVTHSNSNSDCGKDYWSTSLQFCNIAKVSGPTYNIGGLSSITIKIDEKKKTAVIKMTKGNAKCKIVSENGEMKVSISALSEELLIEGAKEIRKLDDGKCEFVLSLGKGAAKALPSDPPGNGVTSEDKENYNILSPIFNVGKGALDLVLSWLSYLHDFFF